MCAINSLLAKRRSPYTDIQRVLLVSNRNGSGTENVSGPYYPLDHKNVGAECTLELILSAMGKSIL